MSVTYTEPTLFDAPATRGASRSSDPTTSRDAARSVSGPVLRDQQARVLGAFQHAENRTAWEVTCWLNVGSLPVKENVVAKRLGELAERGMVRATDARRPGSSHRLQIVYVLTEQGREWLEARAAA